jgi:hypothetical protein
MDTGDETTGWRLPSGPYDVPLAIADMGLAPGMEGSLTNPSTPGGQDGGEANSRRFTSEFQAEADRRGWRAARG